MNEYFQKPTLAALMISFASACSANTADEPSEPPDHEQLKTAKYASVTNVAPDDTLNIRATPSSKAELVAQIPPGDKVLTLGSDDGWEKVVYAGQFGWVFNKYLSQSAAPTFADANLNRLTCIGTEPHWKLQTQGNLADYGMYGEKRRFLLDSSVTPALAEQKLWHATLYAPPINDSSPPSQINILVKTEQCSDGMSDTVYSQTLYLINNHGDLLKGCCN